MSCVHSVMTAALRDTSLDSPDDVCEPGAEVRVTSQTYVVKARSIVVLSRHREGDHNTPW
jgi:hypothetical protein